MIQLLLLLLLLLLMLDALLRCRRAWSFFDDFPLRDWHDVETNVREGGLIEGYLRAPNLILSRDAFLGLGLG